MLTSEPVFTFTNCFVAAFTCTAVFGFIRFTNRNHQVALVAQKNRVDSFALAAIAKVVIAAVFTASEVANLSFERFGATFAANFFTLVDLTVHCSACHRHINVAHVMLQTAQQERNALLVFQFLTAIFAGNDSTSALLATNVPLSSRVDCVLAHETLLIFSGHGRSQLVQNLLADLHFVA